MRPSEVSFRRVSLLAAEYETCRVTLDLRGDDIEVGRELAQLADGVRQLDQAVFRELLDGCLAAGDELVELLGSRIDIRHRSPRLLDRLAQIARVLAGQRLARRLVLRSELQGDQVERIGERVELGEGVVELG